MVLILGARCNAFRCSKAFSPDPTTPKPPKTSKAKTKRYLDLKKNHQGQLKDRRIKTMNAEMASLKHQLANPQQEASHVPILNCLVSSLQAALKYAKWTIADNEGRYDREYLRLNCRIADEAAKALGWKVGHHHATRKLYRTF